MKTDRIFRMHYDTPLGGMTAYSDGTFLTALDFDRKDVSGESRDRRETAAEIPVLRETGRWLDTYFKGKIPSAAPPVRLDGTTFQLAVWSILQQIPYGKTVTYGSIAKQIAEKTGQNKMSAQAVGQAVGHNPVSIIVPCHRVIGSDGSLTGYAGGLDKKKWMLALEKGEKRCSEKCGGSHRN